EDDTAVVVGVEEVQGGIESVHELLPVVRRLPVVAPRPLVAHSLLDALVDGHWIEPAAQVLGQIPADVSGNAAAENDEAEVEWRFLCQALNTDQRGERYERPSPAPKRLASLP